MKSLSVTIQIKATLLYFLLVLSVLIVFSNENFNFGQA